MSGVNVWLESFPLVRFSNDIRQVVPMDTHADTLALSWLRVGPNSGSWKCVVLADPASAPLHMHL